MCEICEWQGQDVYPPRVNWPWTERNELEEWTPEDGYDDE